MIDNDRGCRVGKRDHDHVTTSDISAYHENIGTVACNCPPLDAQFDLAGIPMDCIFISNIQHFYVIFAPRYDKGINLL